jgi:hypothetical protein
MIRAEVKIEGERLAERLVKDVHAGLKVALRDADLWNSLDYFEISLAMKKKAKCFVSRFRVAFVCAGYQ